MEQLQFTIGFSPTAIAAERQSAAIEHHLNDINRHRPSIYDLHFPHYNPQICSSGRPVRGDLSLDQAREITLDMIDWNRRNTGFKMTLLLNYLLHDNHKVVVDNFTREFYPRQVRSLVVADLELIKRLKDRFPDLEIQGSCLSHRMTEEELAEEAREGVTLHNPSVNIIRRPEQIKRNAEAGFAQKIIAFEGCLHNCPDENDPYGHRWYLARSLHQESSFCTKTKIASDPRYFFKANWITVQRFKQLMPCIEVVKLPRCRSRISFALKSILEAYFENKPYDIVDFIGAGYQMYLARDVGRIPSDLFDDHFFDTIQDCRLDCRQRGCSLCFDIMNTVKRMSYKQKRLAGRDQRRVTNRTWHVDSRLQKQENVL